MCNGLHHNIEKNLVYKILMIVISDGIICDIKYKQANKLWLNEVTSVHAVDDNVSSDES